MATTAVESVVEAKRVLAAVAVTVEARADELSALDAALGDGDHGVSLNIGWRAVMADLDGYDAPDVGALLQGVGLTIVNSVGAAMGPLYGTAFVRAGKAVAGKGTFDGADVAAMLEAARPRRGPPRGGGRGGRGGPRAARPAPATRRCSTPSCPRPRRRVMRPAAAPARWKRCKPRATPPSRAPSRRAT